MCLVGSRASSFIRDIPVIDLEGKVTSRPNIIVLGVNPVNNAIHYRYGVVRHFAISRSHRDCKSDPSKWLPWSVKI